MLLIFLLPLQSVLTLLLKMQICSKVWYYQGTFEHNTNFIFTYVKFHLWGILDQCRKLHPAKQICRGIYKNIQALFKQLSISYLSLPCVMSHIQAHLVLEKNYLLPLNSNSQAATLWCTLPQGNFWCFLRKGAMAAVVFMYYYWICVILCYCSH